MADKIKVWFDAEADFLNFNFGDNQNSRKIFLHETVRLLYFTPALKVEAEKFNTTITIKLFFLWLPNAYESGSRLMTIAS